MYLLNEPTQDLPLQSIRPSLPGSSCLIFLLLSIRHNWKSSRETETYIYSHTAVRGSEWATHKHKPALPAVDDDGRLQPVAEATRAWPAKCLDLSIFFSAERGARKGGGALGGPPRIANGDAGTTFSSTGSGGLGGV